MPRPAELAAEVSDTPGALLDLRSRLDPHGVALDYPGHGRQLTFAQWDRESSALGKALLELGLTRGDRVALLAENRVEWSLVQMAVARAGLVLVPVNTHSRSEDLHHVLAQSESRCLVLTESFRSNAFLDLVDGVRERLPDLEHTVVIGGSRKPGTGRESLEDLIAAGSRSLAELPEVRGDDPAVIIYTSGTTGRPKGVVLRHAAVMANGRAVFERLGVDASDVVTSIVPMFHSASFCAALPGCLATGASYVGLDAFDAVEMMQVIQSRRVTVHIAVPTTLRAMLQHPRRKEFDLSSLRVATCGGADTDPEMLAACIAEFPLPGLVQGYGLTEASALVTLAAPEPGRDLTTAGLPLPGYEVRIASVDTGEILPVGVTGEVQVRTPNRMTEYFRLPEATEAAFTADGWLKTGDLGELTSDGELRLTGGRLKDMIIRGGENIYPAEVENTLLRHPQVLGAAVFGIPDPALGEIVAAAIVCDGDPTAEELSRFCAEQIARFKAPSTFFRVADFPLTPSGKIRKSVLRERALSGVLSSMSGGSDAGPR
jgi:fatty-acyl-CoA synthase